MFHTNEANLALIAQTFTVGTEYDSFLPLAPSSNIVFEFHQDEPGKLTVKGFINDQQVTLNDCGTGTIDNCSAETFM